MSVTHGLAGTYRTGCRCTDCREAHRVRCAAECDRRAERIKADPSLAEHGTKSTYSNWGCRCDPCAEANAADCREYRRRIAAPSSAAPVPDQPNQGDAT